MLDRFGQFITIQRDVNGVATSIVSPDGIVTEFVVDGNGDLGEIRYPHRTDPAQQGPTYEFLYENPGVGQPADALMTAKIEPKGNLFTHTFDPYGRVIGMTNQEGGSVTYSRFIDANGFPSTTVTTAEGDVTTYEDAFDADGNFTSAITAPNGDRQRPNGGNIIN